MYIHTCMYMDSFVQYNATGGDPPTLINKLQHRMEMESLFQLLALNVNSSLYSCRNCKLMALSAIGGQLVGGRRLAN